MSSSLLPGLILAFSIIGLLLAFLPAYTDWKDFWTVDSDAIRWVGVLLFAVGGALIDPHFVNDF